MNRIRKRKILYRVLLFALPLLVLSIVMTGAILSWTSYTHFQKTIKTDYRNIIKSSAGEIHLFIKNAQGELEALVRVIAATKLNPWQREMALAAFNHTATEFMSVSLISTQGKQILSTGWGGTDAAFGQSETFKKGRMGQNAISGVMLTKEKIPYIHIAVPIYHLGEVNEVLWGELSLKSVWDVLKGIHVGHTGQVYIMDVSGRVIGHQEIDRVVRTLPAGQSEILTKLRESDAPIEWIEEKDNTKLYCVGYYIPDFDWVIVLSQTRKEIYAYLYRNIYWAVFITCFISLVAILLGWNRVKHFLAPIHTLHHQVQKIGQGDLDQKASVHSQDEIGDLGLAFNKMTTDLKRFISREVETAKELAHAKNLAILGTTSSKVTHEVGNFLNNVGLTLSTLEEETLSSRGKKALEIMENDAARVRTFIENFLRFAKKPELHLERVSIDKIVREVLFVHQPDAEKRGIHVELNCPPDLPLVNIDPRLMYQALNNLVKNSLEAMTEPGSLDIEIWIEGEHLLITIEDTGPGMEPGALEQIFDPFFTTKGRKGTGLGLSIVKTVVEAHRGSIECRSALEKGTTFILRLRVR